MLKHQQIVLLFFLLFIFSSPMIFSQNNRFDSLQNVVKKDSILDEEARDIKAGIKYKYFLKDSLDKTKQAAYSLAEKVIIRDHQLLLSRYEKILWIVGFVVLVILLGFFLILVKVRKVKMENKQLMTEQKLLRSQMNPHFIFNSIQNIRSLIIQKKEEEAINYLNRFSHLTRQILESSNENYTSLTDEIELIESYINLQKMLYSKSFEYNIFVDELIDTDSLFLPPMLTQPFIENAIKHGLNGTTKNGLVAIRFYMKVDKLFFEVTDNGRGFSTIKNASNHKSMAMTITRERLLHYTKRNYIVFNAKNILDDNKNIIGAKVTFEIPYIYEN